jgi:hypothetical protein
MSIKLMNAAWAVKIAPLDKLVLMALADWANDDGHCWPSLAKLAEKSSACRRTVISAIKRLQVAGHITRQPKPGKGVNYIIHPCSRCTSANIAPVQEVHPTSAADAPQLVQQMHPIHHYTHQETPKADARPAAPLDKVVFDTGLAILCDAGVAQSKARSIIGRWKRDYGSGAVMEALALCQKEGAVEPVSYVTKVLVRRKRSQVFRADTDSAFTSAEERSRILSML